MEHKQVQKVVLDQESYKSFKAQGKSDAEIAREYGISQATLSYHKKRWFSDVVKPEAPKDIPSKESTPKEDKTKEYEYLINQLREQVRVSEKNVADKNKMISELEATIQKYQGVGADYELEISTLKNENKLLQEKVEELTNKNTTLGVLMREELEEKQQELTTEIKALKNLLRLYLSER